MAQTVHRGTGSVREENVIGHGSAANGPIRQNAKSPADQRFDMWLEKQLHAMYEIASEPRPTAS